LLSRDEAVFATPADAANRADAVNRADAGALADGEQAGGAAAGEAGPEASVRARGAWRGFDKRDRLSKRGDRRGARTVAGRTVLWPQGVTETAGSLDTDDEAAAPRDAGARGLLRALARADAPEDVLKILIDRQDDAGALARALPGQAGRLVDRIRTLQVASMDDAATLDGGSRAEATASGTAKVSKPGETSAPVQYISRTVVRSARSLRTGSSSSAGAASGNGVGASRLMKLSNQLLDLIHLAEQRRDEAQQMVRMAEDAPNAHASGGGVPQDAAEGEAVNLRTLQREVLDAVRRELELSRERGGRGANAGIWW
jgi:hypothetical protein